MKKILLVMLVVLVLAAVAADAWLRSFAESRATERLAEVLELEGDTSVALGGWPFTFRLLAGNFPSVSVTADEIVTRGARLQSLEVRLFDVDFEAGDLLSGSADAVTAATGEGSALLTEDGLRSLAGEDHPNVKLTLQDGELRVSSPRLPGPVTGDVFIRKNGRLVVRVPGLSRNLRITIPVIVEGLSYEDLEVRDGAIAVFFALEDARLRRGE